MKYTLKEAINAIEGKGYTFDELRENEQGHIAVFNGLAFRLNDGLWERPVRNRKDKRKSTGIGLRTVPRPAPSHNPEQKPNRAVKAALKKIEAAFGENLYWIGDTLPQDARARTMVAQMNTAWMAVVKALGKTATQPQATAALELAETVLRVHMHWLADRLARDIKAGDKTTIRKLKQLNAAWIVATRALEN